MAFLVFVLLIGVFLYLTGSDNKGKDKDNGWKGTVVAKYTYQYEPIKGKGEMRTAYAIDLYDNQTVETLTFSPDSVWKSIKRGDYLINNSGSGSIEKGTIEDEDKELIQMLNNKNVNARQYAIDRMRQIGDEKAVPALIEALGDVDERVYMNAALALKKIGTPEAIRAVRNTVNKSVKQTHKPPQQQAKNMKLQRMKLTEEDKEQLQAKISQEQK